MSLISRTRKQLLFLYFALREWWPLWFYVLNGRARTLHARHPVSLSPAQERIVRELSRDGIAFSSLEELFPGENLLETFTTYARSLESGLVPNVKKDFIVNYWELVPEFDQSNPFVKFSLTPTILNIAKSYLRMWVRFKYYHLAKTLPVGESEATFSQRWHRDPEEKRMMKVFVYLNDVDADTGPFTYVRGSTYGGRYGHVGPQRPPEGSYPAPTVIEAAVAKEDILEATAPAGTVIFCDTSGLHRGGYARSKERMMFTASYNAPTFSEPSRYRFTSKEATTASLPEDVQFALSGELMTPRS